MHPQVRRDGVHSDVGGSAKQCPVETACRDALGPVQPQDACQPGYSVEVVLGPCSGALGFFDRRSELPLVSIAREPMKDRQLPAVERLAQMAVWALRQPTLDVLALPALVVREPCPAARQLERREPASPQEPLALPEQRPGATLKQGARLAQSKLALPAYLDAAGRR